MREAKPAGADAVRLWRVCRGLWVLMLLSMVTVLLVAGVPQAWATPGQSPLRKTVPSPGSIAGTVYNDLNRNQQEDTGEQGIPDVQLTLLAVTGALTTTTNSLDNYWFRDLEPGLVYTVTETTPAGYSSTTADTVEVTVSEEGELVNFGDYRAMITLLIILKNYARS
jgi:hypothetical protein